jgi:hypothetical protein
MGLPMELRSRRSEASHQVSVVGRSAKWMVSWAYIRFGGPREVVTVALVTKDVAQLRHDVLRLEQRVWVLITIIYLLRRLVRLEDGSS